MTSDEFGAITDQEVYEAICTGEAIELYPEDKPYPSALMFGSTLRDRPLHILCAYDSEAAQTVIIRLPARSAPLGAISGEKEMTCVICHGVEVQFQEVEEDLKVGNNVVHVPIRVLLCRTCGERYYDRRAMRYLEEVDQKLKEGSADLREVGKVLAYG